MSSSLGLGQCLGPLYGATVYAMTNFRTTEDIMAIIAIVFSIIYFLVADGKGAIKETFRKNESNELKEGAESSKDRIMRSLNPKKF